MNRIGMLCLLAATVLLAGCSKEPGEGGKAAIKGKVYAVKYSRTTGQPIGVEYYVQDQRVYIVYGDHEFYDDDVRTDPDGLFRFSWLRKGKYTLYTYSECNTCPGGTFAVYKTVEIGDRKETVDAGTLVIEDW